MNGRGWALHPSWFQRLSPTQYQWLVFWRGLAVLVLAWAAS